MTKREKNLAIVVAALLVLTGGWWLWGKYQTALATRQSDYADAELSLGDKKLDQAKARAKLERLEQYQARSLPTDPQVAQLEYRAWLIDRVKEAGLDMEDVTLTENRSSGDDYTSLGYSAQASGDLREVTKFLHAFYDSSLLHKLTSLKLIPTRGDELSVSFTVEALAVRGAVRKSGMPPEGSGRPALGDADAYLASIVERDLFTRYTPPRPPRPKPIQKPRPVVQKPPPKPKFDDAAHAYVTALVGLGDRWQAWITVRTTGERLQLTQGDALKVGLLKGKVESVDARQIVVRTDDKLFATPLGSNLREGKELAQEDALF